MGLKGGGGPAGGAGGGGGVSGCRAMSACAVVRESWVGEWGDKEEGGG